MARKLKAYHALIMSSNPYTPNDIACVEEINALYADRSKWGPKSYGDLVTEGEIWRRFGFDGAADACFEAARKLEP